MTHPQQNSVKTEEIAKVLEPLIRRVIREELARIIKEKPDTFYLDPDMPLYKDMEELRLKKNQGKIKLHSHKEVWRE
jgi:hypothetical protein